MDIKTQIELDKFMNHNGIEANVGDFATLVIQIDAYNNGFIDKTISGEELRKLQVYKSFLKNKSNYNNGINRKNFNRTA
jgi:hypothetical protein